MRFQRRSALFGALLALLAYNAAAFWEGPEKNPVPVSPVSQGAHASFFNPAVRFKNLSLDILKPLRLKGGSRRVASPEPLAEPERIPLPAAAGDSEAGVSPPLSTEDALARGLAGVGEYVRSGVGIHRATGMPQDHVQLHPLTGRQLGFPANYSAPSKLGVYFPYLLKVFQGHPMLKSGGLGPEESLRLMRQALYTLRRFQKEAEGRDVYAGLFPWFEMKRDGSLRIMRYGGRRMIPLLDNGQLTAALWAWLGESAIQKAASGTLAEEVRILLHEVLQNQHYEKLVDPRNGLLYAEWDLDEKRGLEKPWHASLWTEWMIANYLMTVQGVIRVEDWLTFARETFVYPSDYGPLDMPQGYIFSMHELWELVYFDKILMKSKLAPLFKNYLYLQASHAARHRVAGMVATEYGPGGYEQAGVHLSRARKGKIFGAIDNEFLATAYGSALASLIEPSDAGMSWTRHYFEQPGAVKRFGPVTSYTLSNGATDMHTADSTFMTAAALAGGVSGEIARYALLRYGKSEEELVLLFDLHARAILKKLGRKDFRVIKDSEIPLPSADATAPAGPSSQDESGGVVRVTERLYKAGWHGKNVRVPQEYLAWKTYAAQKWLWETGEFIAAYNIPKREKTAWLGAPVKPVSLKRARFVSFWIPDYLEKQYWELELKHDSLEIAGRIQIDTSKKGTFSQDGKWKKIVMPLELGASSGCILNYLALSVPSPVLSRAPSKSQGRIHIRDIQFHAESPSSDAA